ncbi:hypothetical protein FRC11_013431 [Ceratobasidium sp. 423]|nr:hypothetical protein FRC11_013431 [Ceratobasidium sp. 423]
MPRPAFRPPEVELLRTKLPDWVRMKGVRATKANVEELLSERRRFIREVTADFLAKFPDRDPSVSDPGPTTYSQEQIELLPQRLRQWFRNNSRVPTDSQVKEKHKGKARTHARNLAAKRYRQQIKEIARELRTADNQLKPLTAFNRATTLFLADLKEKDAVAYDKLYSDARQMRNHAAMDYADLSPEVLATYV